MGSGYEKSDDYGGPGPLVGIWVTGLAVMALLGGLYYFGIR
jgi:hypothetical protein